MGRPDVNQVFWGDLLIEEPIVALTNLIIAVCCFYYWFRINKLPKSSTLKFFGLYFLLMGVANVFGGIMGHAFLSYFDFAWKLPGWIISMFSVMFIERAAISHTRLIFPKRWIDALLIINIVELATFIVLSITYLDFFFVEVHSAYGLLFVVALLELSLFIKRRDAASQQILIAVFFAIVAALFFMNEWIIHQWFNHIVASHLLMCFAIYFIFRGALRLPPAR